MTNAQYQRIKDLLNQKWQSGEIHADEYFDTLDLMDGNPELGAAEASRILGIKFADDPGERATKKAEAEIEKKLKSVYGTAAKELKDNLKDLEKDFEQEFRKQQKRLVNGEITQEQYNSWAKNQMMRQKQVRDKIDQCTGTLLQANEKAIGIVNGEQLTVFAENANFQEYQIDQAAGMNLMFTVYDEHTVERLIRDNPDLLPPKKVNGKKDKAWNQSRITAAVTQAIIQGESIPDLAKRIAANSAASNAASMMRYARTAMTAAQNAGRQEMLQKAVGLGIKCRKRWMATLDGKTRDSHADLDGEVVDIDDHFSNGLLFPGDPNGAPGEVYNCRCTMVYEYDGLDKSLGERRDNETGEMIPDMTYREWKEKNTPEPEKKPTKLEKKIEKALKPDSLESIMKKINGMEDLRAEWSEKKNLLPLADKEISDKAHDLYMSIPEEDRDKLSKLTEIEISKLKTEQAEVFTDRLEELAEAFDGRKISGAKTNEFDGITVGKYKDEYIVLDGNNRTNLAILKGQDKLDVMLVDLDKLEKEAGPKDTLQELKESIENHKGTWTEKEISEIGSKAAAEMEKIRKENGYYEKQAELDKAKEKSKIEFEKADPLYTAWKEAHDNKAPDTEEKWKEYKNAFNKAKKVDLEISKAKRELDARDATAFDLISKFRQVGGLTEDDADDLMDLSRAGQYEGKIRKEMIKAFNKYPREWIISSAEHWLTLKPEWTDERASYATNTGRIKVNAKDRTNIHELAHRFEQTVPAIVKAEKEFYERRTAGEQAQWLGRGYDKDEVTRKDSFLDKYMGKDYGGDAYELVSMGFELAFTEYSRLCKDEDYRNFILGVLCCI